MKLTFADLQEIIEEGSPWHMWVMAYGISHGMMSLALHHGDYPFHTLILIEGTTYYRGELSGGPYQLSVAEFEDAGLRRIRLVDSRGSLEIRFAHAARGKGRARLP